MVATYMTAWLNNQGYLVNWKRVQHLMRLMGEDIYIKDYNNGFEPEWVLIVTFTKITIKIKIL